MNRIISAAGGNWNVEGLFWYVCRSARCRDHSHGGTDASTIISTSIPCSCSSPFFVVVVVVASNDFFRI